MNLRAQLKRIRRFLRDPDSNIWSRALLVNLFNDVQREIHQKTGILQDVRAIRTVQPHHASYLHDWEYAYLSSSESSFYQALRYQQQGDFVFCYRWEGQIDNAGDASDEGAHFTYPWEAFVGLIPGEQVRIRFPSNYHSTKYMAYDLNPIDYMPKKQIQGRDQSYINRTGTPVAYYREDLTDNSFIPYPLPSTISWDDLDESASSADFIYTYSWESTYLSGTGEKITTTNTTDEIEYIYSWETGTYTGTDDLSHGMWLFEGDHSPGLSVVFVSGDTLSDESGTITRRSGSLLSQEEGIAVDVIEAKNNFLLAYDVIPEELTFDNDESDFPIFLRKYIDHGTLARAYRVNNDGKIRSLSDYWDYRFSVDIEAIKRYRSRRTEDRDYRFSLRSAPATKFHRHPRLPSTYPPI